MKLVKFLITLLFPLIFCSCSIFNSGTVHVKYTKSKTKFNDVSYEVSDRIADVSASIRRVQHPKAYGNWNFNVGLSPSIHYDRQKYTTGDTFVDENGDVQQYEDIEMKRGLAFANLGFTLHTPIGQFVLKGGYGGEVYEQAGEFGYDTIKTREVRKLDFNYIGFFANRFFVLTGPRYYVNGYEQFTFAFRIGVYWGPIKKF